MTKLEKTLAKLTATFAAQIAAAITAALKKPDLGGLFETQEVSVAKPKRKYTKRNLAYWSKTPVPAPTPVEEPVLVEETVPGPLALVISLPEPAKVDIFVSKDPEDGYFETVVDGKLYRASRKRDLKRRLKEKANIIVGTVLDAPEVEGPMPQQVAA